MSTETQSWQKFGAEITHIPTFGKSFSNQERYLRLLDIIVSKTRVDEFPYPYIELQLHFAGIPIPELNPESVREYLRHCRHSNVLPFKLMKIEAIRPDRDTLWNTAYESRIYGDSHRQTLLGYEEYMSPTTNWQIIQDQIAPKMPYEIMIKLHSAGIHALPELLGQAQNSNFDITRGFVNFDNCYDLKFNGQESIINREHQFSIYFGRDYLPYFSGKLIDDVNSGIYSGVTFVNPCLENSPSAKLNQWFKKLSGQL